MIKRARGTKQERFAAYSPDRPVDGCWEWQGHRNGFGYGLMRTGPAGASVIERAHRISWELANGAVPDGLFVLHRCDNPPCVRPSHLFLGTNADNVADKVAKGRGWQHPHRDLRHTVQRGEGSGKAAKLTTAQVREIRALAGTTTYAMLGRKYGVHGSQIGHIIRRKSWSHVD